MQDPWNPTQEEIIKWFYSSSSPIPDQDWELVVALPENAEILLEFATDENCPKKRWALSCLYFLVGSFIRSKKSIYSVEDIKEIIDKARNIDDLSIQEWVERSEYLIKHPETFDYNEWCEGGIVYKIDMESTLKKEND